MPATIHSLDDDERRNAQLIRQRQQYIEDSLTWCGSIRNGDLTGAFGISSQQAANDLKNFNASRSGQVAYDSRSKSWIAKPEFAPTSLEPPEEVFRRRPDLRGHLGFGTVSLVGTAWPTTKATILRTLVKARLDRRPVEVLYQSMTVGSAAPRSRSICPHAFFEDWAIGYVRAYCYARGDFRDFRIDRFHKAALCGRTSWMTHSRDTDWHATIGIDLEPHPDLKPEQRVSSMDELGLMTYGGTLTVRRSHLFYVLRRLGMLEAVQAGHGRPEPSKRYLCTNSAELSGYLPALQMDGTGSEASCLPGKAIRQRP